MNRRELIQRGAGLAAVWSGLACSGPQRKSTSSSSQEVGRMVEVIESGIVYRNPDPGLRAIHAWGPFVGKVSDKELLCIYRRGQAMGSADGRIYRSRSTDGGKSWTEEGPVVPLKQAAPDYDYRAGAFVTLDDGTLLLACARFFRPDPDEPFYNPKTEGYRGSDILLFRSTDQGRTWSAPQLVPFPKGIFANMSHGPRRINPQRLLLPLETWKSWDDPDPVKQKVLGLVSDDRGRSWKELVTIADGTAERIYYWDVRVLPLGGDRMLAFFWTHDARADKDLPIHQAMSTDGGRTWAKPQSTGIEGQVCNIEDTGDGRVLMAYNRRYGESPGIIAVVSTDAEGRNWGLDHQATVWDARTGTHVGAGSKDAMLADMMTWAFGYPCVARIQDKEFLVCFWATQACVTHVRWAKLRIS